MNLSIKMTDCEKSNATVVIINLQKLLPHTSG